jgi:hypothetical protein
MSIFEAPCFTIPTGANCHACDPSRLSHALTFIPEDRMCNTVGPVIIREVPKIRSFETSFQISYSVCECVAMISAVCVNMSRCFRGHGIKECIYLGL